MSIFVLLIAQTRSVWLGTAVAGFVTLVLFVLATKRSTLWKNYKIPIRNSGIAIAACLIAIFIFNVAPRTGYHETSAAAKAGTITNYTSDASAQARLNVWKKSIEMFKDHPALGVGPGNWKIILPKYGLSTFPPTIQDGSIQWTESHNDFIARLCESGIGGALAFLAIFVIAVYLAVRSARAKGNNPHEIILAILIAASTCGFAIVSFFDFPNARVEHSMLFVIWLGMLPMPKRDVQHQSRKKCDSTICRDSTMLSCFFAHNSAFYCRTSRIRTFGGEGQSGLGVCDRLM